MRGKYNSRNSRTSQALRDAGYQRLPDLWVTPDQMSAIVRMAESNADEVNRIRAEAKGERYRGEGEA